MRAGAAAPVVASFALQGRRPKLPVEDEGASLEAPPFAAGQSGIADRGSLMSSVDAGENVARLPPGATGFESFAIPEKTVVEGTPLPTAAEVASCGSRAYFERILGPVKRHGGVKQRRRLASAEQPQTRKGPVTVDVKFGIHDISGVDSDNGTVMVDVSIWASWIDPVVAAVTQARALTNSEMEALWHPELVISDCKHAATALIDRTEVFDVDDFDDGEKEASALPGGGGAASSSSINDNDSSDCWDVVGVAAPSPVQSLSAAGERGRVRWHQRYRAAIINRMDLRAFPLDCDDLKIDVQPRAYGAAQVALRLDPHTNHQLTPVLADYGVLEWSLRLPPRLRVHEESDAMLAFANMGGGSARSADAAMPKRSTARIAIGMERKPQYFFNKVVLVQLLVVVLSQLVLFLDASAFVDKTGILLVLFLTNVAFLFTTNGIIPRVPYVTVLDRFTSLGFFLQFLLAVESFAVYLVQKSIGKEGSVAIVSGIDMAARVLLPLFYLGGIALLFRRVAHLRREFEELLVKDMQE